MLSSEEMVMVLSTLLKGVTKCTYIPDALKSSVMLRHIYLPGLNSYVYILESLAANSNINMMSIGAYTGEIWGDTL